MTLDAQIDKVRSEIRTDGYPMSIGEWISLYENGEIDIHPEFQRFFRWNLEQKSRLIESILLGIPVLWEVKAWQAYRRHDVAKLIREQPDLGRWSTGKGG